MPVQKRTGLVTTNIRLPQALHKKLTQQAQRKGIPLNTLLIRMLEGHDAQTVKAITGIIQPLLDQAIMNAAQIAGHIVAEVAFGKGNAAELKQRLARVGIVMQGPEKPDEK
jgi:hypothetical protein